MAQTKFPAKYTQTLYLDNLTGALYHERYDGGLDATGHSPAVSHNAPVQLKLINVNTYRYRIRVRVHGENLSRARRRLCSRTAEFLAQAATKCLPIPRSRSSRRQEL